jgi:hypothetical protein
VQMSAFDPKRTSSNNGLRPFREPSSNRYDALADSVADMKRRGFIAVIGGAGARCTCAEFFPSIAAYYNQSKTVP